MPSQADIIVGLQWGDEGKGRIVDLYAADYDVVALFAGGDNAGHSIVVGDRELALRIVPSGVMHPHVELFVGGGTVVNLETLIGELRQAKGVRIAILDACRDNSAEQELKRQASRGGPVMRGLAPMKNPGGLIIAYATQYLSTAADSAGSGGNSPFTAALLGNIATPGLDVKDMFFKVGRDVVNATGGKQRPEM